jgi:hypothetical protein
MNDDTDKLLRLPLTEHNALNFCCTKPGRSTELLVVEWVTALMSRPGNFGLCAPREKDVVIPQVLPNHYLTG